MELTLEMLKEWALVEINKEGKDFIYKGEVRTDISGPNCYYVEDGVPSCLVGRILINNGVLTTLDFEGENQSQNDEEIDTLIALGALPYLSRRSQVFLRTLQRRQDMGNSWGDAYDSAAWAGDNYQPKDYGPEDY